jgi:formylglycine-generating enzyme required for sulfatase activity
VVGITWYEAMAFCAWATLHLDDGHVYRLPSEAEWELAARGSERRMYPWGDAPPDRERANYGNVSAGTSAVGSFPAGATPDTGLLDLAGNIWEWTRSEYRPYPYDPADGREDASSPGQKPFTLRGGAWINRPIYLRATFRRGSPPELYNQFIGFRLARHRA